MARSALDPNAVARVIAAYGFDALRGRTGSGTGAVPAHRLASLNLDGTPTDKRTVAKQAAAGIPAAAPPAGSATPFDFAMSALFDWSRNGGQASFEAALEIMGEVVVPLDPEEIHGAMASLLRITVQHEFDSPDARFLTGFAVQDLALEYVRARGFRQLTDPEEATSDEALTWATWLVEQRRQESRQTSAAYETVLSLALLLMRRRPKPGYTVPQIVRAAQSLWIGGVHRAFLEPDEYPEYGRGAPPSPVSEVTGLPLGDGQIEGAMLDLIVGMTEESLFSVNEAGLEGRLLSEGLQRYRTANSIVSLDSLTALSDVDADLARDRYPTDRDFASGCLRWLAGEWEGFATFAVQFRSAAVAAVDALLEWISSVHREFPLLLSSAGFSRGDAAFDEIANFTAVVLARTAHGTTGSVAPDDLRRARRCIEAAAAGEDWRAIARPGRRAR
jgi:hypothetical protein